VKLLDLVAFTGVIVSIIAACSGPGAGKSTFTEGDVQETGGDDDDDTKAPESSSGAATTGDKVFGNTTFTYKPPPENADEHAASHTGHTPLEGQDCTQANCHQATEPWSFCGTVYGNKDGTVAGGQAEIGVVYGDNKIRSAMTDANGNFWLAPGDNPTGVKAVGIRKAGSATLFMSTPLPDGDAGRACNAGGTCHGKDGTAGRIYIQ
jgi:hypothetical protein